MNLIQLFNGFVRNYATLLLHEDDRTLKKFTERKLGYFAHAGEMMGYYTFQEEKLKIKGKNRYLDLVWTLYDSEKKEYAYILHLEHENSLSVEKTLENKLSDAPFLIAINWAKAENYPVIIEAAKAKFNESLDIKKILLILQTNIKEVTLLHGVELSRSEKRIYVKESDGIIKTTETGFFYGILKSEIENWEWEKMISE